MSLLDCLKRATVVVKSRKAYGIKVFWLGHAQHNHIGTKDCKLEHEFEIKTDKSLGLATLPPSTHRYDKTKTFRYSHIGRTDKLETIDELHDILIELLKECLVYDPTNVKGNINDHGKDKGDNRSRDKRQATSTSLYDLSEQMIQTTISYFVVLHCRPQT